MKVKGIIINIDVYDNKEGQDIIKKLFPGVIFNQGEIGNWEDWEDCYIAKEKILDAITKKYMMGMDDGKTFYFSDNDEGLNAIKKVYPELPVIEVDYSDYPWDYDYNRDN